MWVGLRSLLGIPSLTPNLLLCAVSQIAEVGRDHCFPDQMSGRSSVFRYQILQPNISLCPGLCIRVSHHNTAVDINPWEIFWDRPELAKGRYLSRILILLQIDETEIDSVESPELSRLREYDVQTTLHLFPPNQRVKTLKLKISPGTQIPRL